jgi:hypothetical protein
MPPPWKVVAASAAACALAVWLLVDEDENEDDENTPQLCELCDERPEDQETDMTFGLCYQCGRMHCSTCRKKMMMANMQKVQLNEQGMYGNKCPWCRSPMESATPRYLLLQELLERRPKGRHVKHCLFECAVMREIGLGCRPDMADAIKLHEEAAARGHGQACYRLGGFHDDGIGVPQDPAAALRWYERGRELGDPNATGCCASEATRHFCAVARAETRKRVASIPVWNGGNLASMALNLYAIEQVTGTSSRRWREV